MSKTGKITVTCKHADNRQKDFFYRLHRTPSFRTTLIAHRIITRGMQDGNTHSTIRINCQTQIRSVILVTTVRSITGKIDFHFYEKLFLYCDTCKSHHFFIQWEVKLKPIVTCSHIFPVICVSLTYWHWVLRGGRTTLLYEIAKPTVAKSNEIKERSSAKARSHGVLRCPKTHCHMPNHKP